MNVIVTGGRGFVGTHLVRALDDRGDAVAVFDKKDGGDIVSYPDLLHQALKDRPTSVIVHLAATCSTPGSITKPLTTFRDTVASAVEVLDAARAFGNPVIITSSVKARDGKTPYGAAKRMVELWAQEYRSAYNLPVIINRPGTIYGPGQEGSPESGWIAWFLKAAETGKHVTVNGDGWQVRDLLHVSDYVRLLLTQLDNIGDYNTGRIYDVGGGVLNAVTVNEVVRHLGLHADYGPARYGDAQAYVGENDVPGWQPTVHWRASETLGGIAPPSSDSELMTVCDCSECVCWMPTWREGGESRCYQCATGDHRSLGETLDS